MGLIFDKDIPCGNGHLWYITENKSLAEIAFSPEPHGGPEAMWFCFRIARGKNCRTKKIKLVLKHFKIDPMV